MTALVAAVFLASLLGSLHCVGMCGAFMAVIVGEAGGRATQVGYHAGRLLTYVTLGALAGVIGGGMNVAGAMAGLQPVALSFSAAAIVTMGALTWLRLRGVRVAGVRGPKWVHGVASAGYRIAMRRPPVQRALLVGLLTTLLPCGWLWTFLITAAGTAKPATAAVVMLVFWAGTLPAMVTLGTGLRGVLGVAQRRVPTLTCLAMIGVGLFTIAGRARLDPLAWAAAPAPTTAPADVVPPCCEVSHADAH